MYKQVFIGIGILVGSYFLNLAWKDQISDPANATKNVTKMESGDSIISSEMAGAIALNSLKETENGVELSHPNHSVRFEREGVFFQPKKGPEWNWQLTHIGTENEALNSVSLNEITPKNNRPRIVSYKYGNITEEYHAKQSTVEQRFVIDDPLPLGGQDLVIRGQVITEGQFEELDEGWAWSDSEGQVKLGDVTVFDAKGQILMASMNVTAQSTEIIVDAHALAAATYPVTVDPEIGANDFLISDTIEDSFDPVIAYNSTDDEYFVVWQGMKDGELEIYGQRLDAFTGAEVGPNDIRISDMGPDGSGLFVARGPAVAYNSVNNEYLVVWRGDDDTFPLVDDEFEIFGQRLDASGGEIGSNDFRISDMGPDGDTSYGNVSIDHGTPLVDIAYNSTNNEYLVVWQGDDNVGPLVDDDEEIFGQRLDASGGEIGSNDFRISDMGTDGSTLFKAKFPEVAYNSIDNEYLVVWEGNDDSGMLHISETEIYTQRLDAVTGAEIGANDLRISDMGPDGHSGHNAHHPAVAYNSVNNEYLVVWFGSDNIAPLVLNEFEVFGQRLDAATGSQLGVNDFRISDMGPDGVSFSNEAREPKVAYSRFVGEYIVVWHGDDDVHPLVPDETEAFGQRLDAATGAEIGDNDFRLSDMGPNGAPFSFYALRPAIASSSTEFCTVWYGVDSTSSVKHKVYGQLHDRKIELKSDTDKISIATGGVQNLTLNFGADHAGSPYLLLGSTIGTNPGILIDGQNIPLNPDAYFSLALTNPNTLPYLPDNFGFLDAAGQATLRVVIPTGLSPALAGITLHHAAVVLDLAIFQGVMDATNSVKLDLID